MEKPLDEPKAHGPHQTKPPKLLLAALKDVAVYN
jgi:hypothetical protein